jgi:aminopeptidase N
LSRRNELFGWLLFGWLCLWLALPVVPAVAADRNGFDDPDPAMWEKPPPIPGAPLVRAGQEPPAGDRGFDVQHYELDLRIDVPLKMLDGAVEIELQALRRLQRVRLDLVGNLTVDYLLWQPEGGAPPIAAPYEHAGDSLVVQLATPLATGLTGRLRITYHGQPQPHGLLNSGLLFRSYGDTPEDYRPAVFSVSQPWSAHSWWPCKDHPGDKATARIAITLPPDYVGVSNGTLVLEEEIDGYWHRVVWREDYPIATYLVSVAISTYQSWHEICPGQAGPVLLSYYVYPPDREGAELDLAPTCRMMQFLENLFGPYPFGAEKYAQAAMVWGGAMENQTVTSHGRFVMAGTGRYERLIMHEFAHQWFGDYLTPAHWRDIWLNEGFARYSEALWLEHTEGRQSYLDYMARIGPERHPDLFASMGILTDPDPILPNLLVYNKGAWVLHMLRGYLGDDDLFFNLLYHYATEPRLAFGNVTTADFLTVASRVAGRDLRPALKPWLDSDAVPTLAWRWEQNGHLAGRVKVTLHAAQLQARRFDLALPVHITTDQGIVVRRARLNHTTGRFSWIVPGPVRAVALDPEGWVLFRLLDAPQPKLRFLPPTPNPARTADISLRFTLRSDAPVTCNLYDVRGRKRGRWALGTRPATEDEPEEWVWNGRDGQGRVLPAGVYWLELLANGSRAVHKITILH